jgi:hypothetical protein
MDLGIMAMGFDVSLPFKRRAEWMKHMQSKTGTGISIVLSILAFIIGLGEIVVLIAVGEAANNTIIAFAAVSFPSALLAGIFSWIAPRARWAIGIVMSVPIAILAIIGSWSSSWLLAGAIWTIALTCAGAYLGGRLGERRSVSPKSGG